MNTFYGLLGQSLGHSLSPIIHHYIFETLDISAHYHLFEVDRTTLCHRIAELRVLGAVGLNVTIPYKTEVMQYLDAISPEAAAIGAVNTIVFKGEAAEGYNTDYHGFGMLLERYGISTIGTEALILGYGGGAKAVIHFLLNHGVKSVVVAVRNAHSKELSSISDKTDKIMLIDFDHLPLQKGGDLIINCTPIGMHPKVDSTPVPSDILKKYHTAIDLIYNPYETVFLRDACNYGLRAVNGLYMLVGQAAIAQKIWNNADLGQEQINKIYNKVVEHIQNNSP